MKVYQFSVPILLSVTDTLLCLNEQEMTSCIRRDGFVYGGGDHCPSRLFNAFEPIRILGQTTKKKLREKHDSWQAKMSCHSCDPGSNPHQRIDRASAL